MPTNDEIKPAFIRHYCYDCDSEVANYAEHNADHAISNMLYYSQKQLASVCADTANKIFTELKKYDTGYGDIVLSKEDIEALKKQHWVPL